MGVKSWIGRTLSRLPGVRAMATLVVQNYGHDLPLGVERTIGGRRDVGYDEPPFRAGEAGGAAEWPDPVFALNQHGHRLVRSTPPAIVAYSKLGKRTSKLNWVAKGGNAKRREQMTYMVQQTPGWADMIEFFSWVSADGVRFYQIKTLDRRFNTSDWTLPDLRGGGRFKLRAGGRMHWDGNNLFNARSETGVELKEPALIPEREQFMIHTHGALASPNGDMSMAVAVYNLCEDWWDGRAASKTYKLRYNQEIYTSGRQKPRQPNSQASFRNAAQKVVQLQEAGAEGVIVMSDQDELKLRALHTNGLQDLWHDMDKTAGLIYLMVLLSKITTDSSDQGGVGSSGVGLSEELAGVLANGTKIADTINADLVPWYARNNEALLQPLGDGEEEVYFVPEAPAPTDTGEVGDDESDQDDDPEDPADKPGEDGKLTNPRPAATPATLSRFDLDAILNHLSAPPARNVATLAKPAGFMTPPVHPNCRCRLEIDEDGENVWVDAADARVCPQCRAYGALYNAMERGPTKLTDDEAQAIEDARGSRDYQRAMERDSVAEQKAIRIVTEGELDRDGILSQVVKQRGGVAPNATELQEAVEMALDVSRSAADVRGGIQIGTGSNAFTLPEAVIAPPASPGMVRPQFVAAVVTRGQAYSVVQANYRWRVITSGGRGIGRVIASEDSLWLALLVFAELERRRRKRAEEERTRRELRMAEAA